MKKIEKLEQTENIEIRSFFSDWHKVDKQTAINYIKWVIESTTGMKGEKLIKFIEEKRLRGITVEELLKNQ